MEATNIEKWLKENTFQCPMGRVSLQQCEALRKRPKFGAGGFTVAAKKVNAPCPKGTASKLRPKTELSSAFPELKYS